MNDLQDEMQARTYGEYCLSDFALIQRTQFTYDDGFLSKTSYNTAVNASTRDLPSKCHPDQTKAMSFEEMLDSQYSPDSFDFLDVDMEEAMPHCPEFHEPSHQQDQPFHSKPNNGVTVLSEDRNCLGEINDYEQTRLIPRRDVATGALQSDYTFLVHQPLRSTVQETCSKIVLEHDDESLELLSLKATEGTEMSISGQLLSSREFNLPAAYGTTRFSPLLEKGDSLLDCWLAGVGQQFDSTDAADRICSTSYPPDLTLKTDSVFSSTRPGSKAVSICSSVSRAASGPRQGRRKRSAPGEDSASSTGSSQMSKKTQSSITCPNLCGASFKTNFTLKRHLNSACSKEQVVRESWICGPLSHLNDGQRCPVCQLNAYDGACTHRMAECWARTEAGSVTFYRRDAIKTHLMDYHRLQEDAANRLADQMKHTYFG